MARIDRTHRILLVLAVAAMLPTAVVAADERQSRSRADAVAQLRASLEAKHPDVEIDSIRPTPVDGLFEVVSGSNVYYLTPDARYLVRGQLIDLDNERNLTRRRRSEQVHDLIAGLDESRMVVFEPTNGPAKERITVFTDTTCPYCRELHQELLALVDRHPVKVRYLMYPRAGTGSSAADTLRDIWCAADRATAMTRAKAGKSIPERDGQCTTPIEEHMRVARELGVRGTPFMVLGDDGPIVPGYRTRDEIVSMLGLDGDDGDTAASE